MSSLSLWSTQTVKNKLAYLIKSFGQHRLMEKKRIDTCILVKIPLFPHMLESLPLVNDSVVFPLNDVTKLLVPVQHSCAHLSGYTGPLLGSIQGVPFGQAHPTLAVEEQCKVDHWMGGPSFLFAFGQAKCLFNNNKQPPAFQKDLEVYRIVEIHQDIPRRKRCFLEVLSFFRKNRELIRDI